MTKLQSIPHFDERSVAEALVIPYWQGKKGPECAAPEAATLPEKEALHSGDFKGKEGETLLLYGKGKQKRLLLLGLGKEGDGLRRAYAAALKVAMKKRWESVNFLLPKGEGAREVAEGLLLANYTFDSLKSEAGLKEAPVPVKKIGLIGGGKKAKEIIDKAIVIVGSTNFARDLVNGNASDVTAQYLASQARHLEKTYSKLKVSVLDKKALEKEKMGLMLAVNQGAAQEPALILLKYEGDPKSKEWTAIIGKGITYDTGGLNIKPTGSMETMKADMSGAAAVLGTIRAAAELGLKENILGVVASAENAVGPQSYKPGDVYKSHSGKTVEISNTDAEGRLVLADAISYVQKHYAVKRMIDLATLTGGIVVAIGEEASGLFSNNEKLAQGLMKAGDVTHERVWRMPLYEEYHEPMKSQIADIRNSGGGRGASPCKGAIFLKFFVNEEIPWAHLDIAGTAYLSELKGYYQTPATGVGVRLLIEYLENLD